MPGDNEAQKKALQAAIAALKASIPLYRQSANDAKTPEERQMYSEFASEAEMELAKYESELANLQ